MVSARFDILQSRFEGKTIIGDCPNILGKLTPMLDRYQTQFDPLPQ